MLAGSGEELAPPAPAGLLDLSEDIALKTCRALRDTCSEDTLWQQLFQKSFSQPSISGSTEPRVSAQGQSYTPSSLPTLPSPRQSRDGPSTASSPSREPNWRQRYRDRWVVDAGWRADNKQQVHVLERHPACIYALRLLPESKLMVSAGADEEVVVWGYDGSLRSTLRGHHASIRALDASGNAAVSGSQTAEIFVWSLDTGSKVALMAPEVDAAAGPRDSVRCVKLLPERQAVLSGQQSGSIKLWDLRTGAVAREFNMLAGGYGVPTDNLSPCAVNAARLHEHLLVAVGECISIQCFDMRASQQPCSKILAHKRGISCMDMQYPFLATGSMDDTVKLWNIPAMSACPATADAGSSKTGTESNDDVLQRLNMAEGALLGEGAARCHWSHGFITLRLSEDWRLVTASEDGGVRLWDVGPAKGMPSRNPPRRKVLPLVHGFMPCHAGEPVLQRHQLAFPPGTPAADVPALAGLDGYNASRKATLTLDLDDRLLAVAGRDSIIRVFAYGPPSPPSPQGSPVSPAGSVCPSSSNR